jgi:ankyrin repeat protein
MLACAKGNRHVVLLLCATLRKAGDVSTFAHDKKGKTALIHAATNGHAEAAGSVLDAVERAWLAGNLNWFTYLHHKDREGKTALDHAKANKHEKAIAQIEASHKKLLDDYSPGFHGTAVEKASEKGDLALLEKLLAAGASVQLGKGSARTALLRAAKAGHTPVVRRLLATFGKDAKARIAYVTQKTSYYVPLHEAASAGHLLVVQELLEAFGDDKDACRAHAEAVTFAGGENVQRTAMGHAENNGHQEIVTLLRKHGATK